MGQGEISPLHYIRADIAAQACASFIVLALQLPSWSCPDNLPLHHIFLFLFMGNWGSVTWWHADTRKNYKGEEQQKYWPYNIAMACCLFYNLQLSRCHIFWKSFCISKVSQNSLIIALQKWQTGWLLRGGGCRGGSHSLIIKTSTWVHSVRCGEVLIPLWDCSGAIQ